MPVLGTRPSQLEDEIVVVERGGPEREIGGCELKDGQFVISV